MPFLSYPRAVTNASPMVFLDRIFLFWRSHLLRVTGHRRFHIGFFVRQEKLRRMDSHSILSSFIYAKRTKRGVSTHEYSDADRDLSEKTALFVSFSVVTSRVLCHFKFPKNTNRSR
ncbi:hypothetical protein CDAR_467541 [Caerostris darwini]|uniref:Uncharacterized protein n=1 Tax=Caerostris darwini TaxID=1538125 RepID=A0AAV4RR82_9ARAC|nr:hypothetical protein CDAR_467541 [Caerostris darwini]